MTILDTKIKEDEQVVEDFYKMLPMLLTLFRAMSTPTLPLPFPLSANADPVERGEAFIEYLIRLKENKQHLTKHGLSQIDIYQISPEVQRLIKAKQ